jgi:type 1 glutamine amidotransferase
MKKKGMSRRQVIDRAALAASLLPFAANAQAPQAGQTPAPAAGGRGGRGGMRRTPGGSGPIQVLLITKGHAYNRQPFFELFDALGTDITWTHVEHPAAQVFFNPELAKPYDVFVFYDMAGRGRRTKPDGTAETYDIEPSPELRKNFKALLESGKGLVFFHHALASWVHTWPEYVETMGGAADWGRTLKNIRGKEYPFSGFRAGVVQKVTIVDKSHPVVQGLEDGFEIEDETYLAPMFEDSVHPLLRTNFEPKVSNFPNQMQRDPNWKHPDGSNMTAWVKTAEKSPVVYIQHGHDERAWTNPNFQKLMGNAIKWASSKEAKDWAAKNPKKIFK